MSTNFRTTIEWSIGQRNFKFLLDSGQGRLHTPDGQIVELNSTEWQEALNAIHKTLKTGSDRSNKKPRTGEAWTAAEETELTSAFKNGLNMSKIASKHQRTPGAIKTRLEKLGLLTKT